MSELDYHTLNDLIQMTALGDAGPGNQLVIKNILKLFLELNLKEIVDTI